MTIKQLRYLLEIEKQGSINKASKSLFVTQPSITKVIKSLEDELGVKVFFRNVKNKQVVFTLEGKELLEYARSLTEQFQIIENSLKNIKVKFCISSQHYSFVIEAFVKEIAKNKDEGFEYTLIEGKIQNVVEDVISMKSSIGLITLYDDVSCLAKKSLEDKGISFNSIKKVIPHIFIRKKHPLASKEIITLKDLEEYPIVLFDQEINALNFCNYTKNNMNCKKVIKVTDRDTIYTIIKNTNAYNIGTGIVNKEIDGDIIVKPLKGEIPSMDIGYLKLKSLKLNKEIQHFISVVTKLINKYTV